MNKLFLILTLTFLTSTLPAQENLLLEIIEANDPLFSAWKNAPEKHQAQIIYTQIDRDENNHPTFTSHSYGLDANRYFYPASTVKLPTALIALEKLNELNIIGLDKHAIMRHNASRPPQTAATADSSAANGHPSLAHYIKKIFLVSDNDAYNRLYEFAGQEYLNRRLRQKGVHQSRIIHRLSVSGFDVEGNRRTNPVRFLSKDGQLLYHQGEVYSQCRDSLHLTQEIRGKARIDNEGNIVKEPFDFRQKNFISLTNLHDLLKVVLFPETVPEHQRFRLSKDDYRFLYKYMSMLPGASDGPRYGEPDNFVKFWIYGDRDSSVVIPPHIRIFNKVGWAYGFLTDVAYIVDLKNGVEFMLAGVIHVNANETYNDGVYEYEAIGLPFFGQLGRKIYEYELGRLRKNRPDFGWLNGR